MKRSRRTLAGALLLVAAAIGIAFAVPASRARLDAWLGHPAGEPSRLAGGETAAAEPSGPPPPAVTVVDATTRPFRDQAFVSGTLVAREDVMVAPQVDGLTVAEVLAEDGDQVREGQVLARLDRSQLDAQLAQNDAALLRADAAIAQAKNQVLQFDATSAQANADYERGRKLELGVLSQATLEQRLSTARSVEAQLAFARSGLAVSEADRKSQQAQRRELEVKMGRTEVRAPAAGVISRRAARVGMLVSGGSDPLFRIIRDGEIDLDAEVPDDTLSRIRVGMTARVLLQGGTVPIAGSVRLIASEVDKATRLGRIRIALPGVEPGRIGSFASAVVDIDRHDGVAVPATAVTRGERGRIVQVVVGSRIETRQVDTGLANRDLVELTQGVKDGETVVARAAAFLRSGDTVRPIRPAMKESQR